MSEIVIAARRGGTWIPNGILPEGISARAWGVFCYLMSRPEGWVCRPRHLTSVFKEGRDALYAAVNELCDHGLLVKEWVAVDGKPPRMRYVFPDPDAGNPNPEKPDPANPDTEKPDYNQYRGLTNTEKNQQTPAAPADADAGEALPGMPEPAQPDPSSEWTPGRVVAAWCEGFAETHPDEVPVRSIIQRAGRHAKNELKNVSTEDQWLALLAAARRAGEQNLFDLVSCYPVQRVSQYVDPAREREAAYWARVASPEFQARLQESVRAEREAREARRVAWEQAAREAEEARAAMSPEELAAEEERRVEARKAARKAMQAGIRAAQRA